MKFALCPLFPKHRCALPHNADRPALGEPDRVTARNKLRARACCPPPTAVQRAGDLGCASKRIRHARARVRVLCCVACWRAPAARGGRSGLGGGPQSASARRALPRAEVVAEGCLAWTRRHTHGPAQARADPRAAERPPCCWASPLRVPSVAVRPCQDAAAVRAGALVRARPCRHGCGGAHARASRVWVWVSCPRPRPRHAQKAIARDDR